MATSMLGTVNPIPIRRPMMSEVAWIRNDGKPLNIRGVDYPRGYVFSSVQAQELWNASHFWALVQQRRVTYGLKNTPVPGATEAGHKLMIVNKGFGKFDVVRGTIVAGDLTKQEAIEMVQASQPAAQPEGEQTEQIPEAKSAMG